MFQVAKWDIVRAKEKEMTAHLKSLQDKQKRLQRCIAHVFVHKIGAKLVRNFQALQRTKKLEQRRLMGTFLLQIKLKFAMRKKGKDLSLRLKNRLKHMLTWGGHVQHMDAESMARPQLLEFLRAAAEKWHQISLFKDTISKVIKFQRAFKVIKMRRIVKRALMDKAWEKFMDE